MHIHVMNRVVLCFLGLVGVSVNQKLFGRNAIRNHKSARSLIQMSRRDPSQWIHHLNFLKRQGKSHPPETTTTNMTATPVSSPVSTVAALAVLKPPSSKTVSPPQTKAVSNAAESGTEMLEVPHVQVESDEEAREARLERQWKELKVDLAELPDVYAKLSKIKLTVFYPISSI
uniref:Uncharacterized protein n=1 Tax=Oncorhynchus kisutch TaxID=8019 RepID=A0A8C7FJ67_ONCKI